VIEPDLKNKGMITRFRHGLAKKLVGDSEALTVVGPSSIVKEIKRDPRKIELFLG
jgi:hypothetical protein